MSFQEVAAAISAGIPAKKISIVHTGIEDFSHPISAESAVLRKVGVINIGFFGRLDFQKGADLLNSIPFELYEALYLHVFGAEGKGRRLLHNDHVVRYGWVPHSSLPAYMSSMDAVVIPSRWEGFSLTALEAMRSGVPIIVSGCTSLTEVVVHGYNGLVMRDYSADALAELISSLTKEDCVRMGHNARKTYEQCFTFDDYYQKIMALYKQGAIR